MHGMFPFDVNKFLSVKMCAVTGQETCKKH